MRETNAVKRSNPITRMKQPSRTASREKIRGPLLCIALVFAAALMLNSDTKRIPYPGAFGRRKRDNSGGKVECCESSLIDQAMMNREEGQFQPVGYSEFVENVVQMILHRLLADKELFANLAVAKALRHQLHDFLLAITQ